MNIIVALLTLLIAAVNAQTDQKLRSPLQLRLQMLNSIPLEGVKNVDNTILTKLVAAGLDLHKLPVAKETKENAWLYKDGAMKKAQNLYPKVNQGQYPLGYDAQEKKAWSTLIEEELVVVPQRKLRVKRPLTRTNQQGTGFPGHRLSPTAFQGNGPAEYDGMDQEEMIRYLHAGGNLANLPPPTDGLDANEAAVYHSAGVNPWGNMMANLPGSGVNMFPFGAPAAGSQTGAQPAGVRPTQPVLPVQPSPTNFGFGGSPPSTSDMSRWMMYDSDAMEDFMEDYQKATQRAAMMAFYKQQQQNRGTSATTTTDGSSSSGNSAAHRPANAAATPAGASTGAGASTQPGAPRTGWNPNSLGCKPEDYIVGFGCVPDLALRAPWMIHQRTQPSGYTSGYTSGTRNGGASNRHAGGMMPFNTDGMDAEDRQRYIMAGGDVANLPPPKDGVDEAEFGLYNWGQGRRTGGGQANTGGAFRNNGINFNTMPFFGEDMFEDFLPFMNYGAQHPTHNNAGNTGTQTNGQSNGQGQYRGSSFLPFMMDGEDRSQYEMFKRGIMTADFDPAEIAQYSAWARAEGVQIPSWASGNSQIPSSTGTQSGSTSSGSGSVGSGDRHTNTQPATTQPARTNTQPVQSNPFGGRFPFMGMDSEDMGQYQMYRNGIYSPDMDMGEIAQYRMYDQYNSNPAPRGYGRYERRRKL